MLSFALLLAGPAHAAPFDAPTQISWELRGAQASCALLFKGDTPQYRCGTEAWKPVERSTRRLDRALKRFSPGRVLNAVPEGGRLGPTLTLHAQHGSVSFSVAVPELLEVVDAARELIAVDDPLAIPEVPFTECDVAYRSWMRPTPEALPSNVQSRDLIVCESGGWVGFEDGHPVARGFIDEDGMEALNDLAEPLTNLGTDPDRWLEPAFCPTVVMTHARGLSIGDEEVPRDMCGYAISEQAPFDQLLRKLVPFRA